MKQQVKLRWSTPNGDDEIVYIARVSNLNPPPSTLENNARLIKTMQRDGHISPFEMANMCVEIITSRAIARQILRHRSFSFQEFSQRYSLVENDFYMDDVELREKHEFNRQMSKGQTSTLATFNKDAVLPLVETIKSTYEQAILLGAAKESARAILPEGYTISRLYMNGNVRSWIFYLKERLNKHAVQKEHVELALAILQIFKEQYPTVYQAFFVNDIIESDERFVQIKDKLDEIKIIESRKTAQKEVKENRLKQLYNEIKALLTCEELYALVNCSFEPADNTKKIYEVFNELGLVIKGYNCKTDDMNYIEQMFMSKYAVNILN